MGALRETRSGRRCILEPRHVIGRVPAPQSSLTLDEPYVSSVHSEIRWSGRAWELKDLGSRNGTFLDGRRIEGHGPVRIVRGSAIGFGKPAQEWVVVDDAPPPVMVVPLTGGEPVTCEGDLLALPSPEDPRVTLYRSLDGMWRLESADEPPRVLTNLKTFEALGSHWRFCCPDMAEETLASSQETKAARLEVGALHLHITVSSNEEYVHVKMSCGDRETDMGGRRHNYLLLTLARQRLADAASGVSEASCGWIDQDDMAHDPSMVPPQLNIDVFRIREQFEKAGVVDAADIIQRRPRQMRLGTGQVTIVKS